jgi:hypothetical protein
MRLQPTTAALAALSAFTLGGCASAPPADPAAKPQAKAECVISTGSSICRKPGTGSPVYSISGDELSRSGGSIAGPSGTAQ